MDVVVLLLLPVIAIVIKLSYLSADCNMNSAIPFQPFKATHHYSLLDLAMFLFGLSLHTQNEYQQCCFYILCSIFASKHAFLPSNLFDFKWQMIAYCNILSHFSGSVSYISDRSSQNFMVVVFHLFISYGGNFHWCRNH